MRSLIAPLILCATCFAMPLAASAQVTMAWSYVGNPGNPADTTVMNDGTTGYGSMAYNYNIGTYDVTNSQYVAFLNSNDATGANTLGLYSSYMSSSPYGGINYNSGAANGSKYSVISGDGNHPVNYETWYSAIRFANWLNNGQVPGGTETGAYTLLGGTPTPSNNDSITRNAGATVFLPSENEWYKAAYYNPATSSYYLYPTSSNTAPNATGPTATPNSANYASLVGNLTDVGAYSGTTSPYGAFDMGGNVYQWNESVIATFSRALRGGSFYDSPDMLLSSYRTNYLGSSVVEELGFRVAESGYLAAQGPLTAFSDHHQQDYSSYNGAGLTLTGINLSGANLEFATFSSGDLTSANLSGANVAATNFTSTNLTNANLQNSYAPQAITAAQLQSAASVTGVNLSGNNLSGFDLHGLNLSGANFSGANLSSDNLASANLSGATFTSATLTGANLDHAILPAALPMLPVINGAVVTLHGTLTVSGQTQVDPGGTLTLDHLSTLNTNGLSLSSSSTITVELAGLTAGSQYSQLNIGGTATLGGTLDVILASGYKPSPGNQFQLFNGVLQNTFATVVLPTLLPGEFWNQSQLYSAGTLSVGGVLGDLNGDGVVNGLDISLVSAYWLRAGQGLPADANADGVVNGLDIALISSNWLQTSVSGAGSRATGVPEPSTLALAVLALMTACALRSRLRRCAG